MNEETPDKPPYLAYTTFKNFLGSLKNGVIPARIDKTLMVGQSGSTQSYLMAAMRFFDLIDKASGKPKPELAALVASEGEDRKKLWKPIFEKGYDPVIRDLDLSSATVGMLHEKFAEKELASETVKKCHSFFAAAAEDAGVTLAPQLKPNARGSSGGPRKSRKKSVNKLSGTTDPAVDDFGDGENNGGATQEPTQLATLLLEGGRSVKFKAPATISKAELERIQNWLSFQFIIEG